MVPWGAGENALDLQDGPQDGLMQDPAQLQGQQGKRQQMVLDMAAAGRQKGIVVVRTAGMEGQLRAQLPMESL